MNETNAVSLIRNKLFIYFFLTLLASTLSVSFYLFTVNWYVVDELQLEAKLGLVFFASSVPRLVFMLIGGAIADRVNKATVMLLSDLTKGLLLVAVIVLLLVDLFSIGILIGLSFVFGLLDAFFWPSSSSLMPSLVSRDQLTRANSIVQTTQRASTIIGPLLAGLVIGFGSYEVMFAFVSAMLLLAAIVDLIIRKNVSYDQDELNESSSVWHNIKEGFAYLKQSPFMLALMLSSVSMNLFLSGPMQVGLPLFARDILNGDEFTYSLLSGMLGVGTLVGALLIGVLNVRQKRGMVALTGIMLLGLFMVAFSLTDSLLLSLMFISLIGLVISTIDVPIISAIQAHTEKKYIGRMMSLMSFASMGLIPVSYLLTSFLISLGLTIDTILLSSSVCLMVVGVFVLVFAKSLRTVN
ncbi:MFS family permease [Alkalibacillus salilacus]|uniref:MFS family permease n=1 Tax=Alkalibacillus salilacus TaxID=284582 RepID=A0ABT9VAX1_9BACI|nr:MFS family permease [Alkalibacillus salilacus]